MALRNAGSASAGFPFASAASPMVVWTRALVGASASAFWATWPASAMAPVFASPVAKATSTSALEGFNSAAFFPTSTTLG